MRLGFLRLLSWAMRCQPVAPKIPLNVSPRLTTWIRMPVPVFVVVSVLVATVGSVVSSAITLNGAGNAPLQYVGDGAPMPS